MRLHAQRSVSTLLRSKPLRAADSTLVLLISLQCPVMHHALLLPDIFRRILDFLEIIPNSDFYSSYQEGREHNLYIARLAQTCTTFLEPCLDALWKHQRTLGPLVKTLPADAYEQRPRTYRGLAAGRPYFDFVSEDCGLCISRYIITHSIDPENQTTVVQNGLVQIRLLCLTHQVAWILQQ